MDDDLPSSELTEGDIWFIVGCVVSVAGGLFIAIFLFKLCILRRLERERVVRPSDPIDRQSQGSQTPPQRQVFNLAPIVPRERAPTSMSGGSTGVPAAPPPSTVSASPGPGSSRRESSQGQSSPLLVVTSHEEVPLADLLPQPPEASTSGTSTSADTPVPSTSGSASAAADPSVRPKSWLTVGLLSRIMRKRVSETRSESSETSDREASSFTKKASTGSYYASSCSRKSTGERMASIIDQLYPPPETFGPPEGGDAKPRLSLRKKKSSGGSQKSGRRKSRGS